jgi:hypothetical protein
VVHVGVKGRLDLYKLAAAFKKAGRKDLGQALDKGIRSSAKVIEKAVTPRSSTDLYMPRGYEQTFNRALKAKHEVRMLRGRSVSITFYATGRKELRALEDIERGRLRHPVHGRYRRLKNGGRMRNPWVTQIIKPGVIEEPAMRAQPEAVRELEKHVKPLVVELNNIT